MMNFCTVDYDTKYQITKYIKFARTFSLVLFRTMMTMQREGYV